MKTNGTVGNNPQNQCKYSGQPILSNCGYPFSYKAKEDKHLITPLLAQEQVPDHHYRYDTHNHKYKSYQPPGGATIISASINIVIINIDLLGTGTFGTGTATSTSTTPFN
jgi:hypothetical protein